MCRPHRYRQHLDLSIQLRSKPHANRQAQDLSHPEGLALEKSIPDYLIRNAEVVWDKTNRHLSQRSCQKRPRKRRSRQQFQKKCQRRAQPKKRNQPPPRKSLNRAMSRLYPRQKNKTVLLRLGVESEILQLPLNCKVPLLSPKLHL